MSITVDVRMLDNSGIGVYLENILPDLISELEHLKINLLGDPSIIGKKQWTQKKNVNIVDFSVPIYSIKEQLMFSRKIPGDTKLFWAPHYNIPLLFEGKLVVTVHDLCHLAKPEFFSSIPKRVYSRLMFQATKYKAEQVITVSKFSAEELMKFTGVEKSKIRVIHNNLNDEWLKKFDDRAPRPYRQPYMLFVGNIKPHKNLRNLLLAFSKVAGDLPHHLVIVGNKSGFITSDNEVVEMAEKLSEKVSFTGHISLDDLKRHYKHAEGLLFPSLYEGFGFPPLEAMSCGCPTLVSNVSSLPEICGDAALYCDPNDVDDIANKILQLAQNQVLRKNLVERGYNQITQFKDGCTKNTINTLLEVYDG